MPEPPTAPRDAASITLFDPTFGTLALPDDPKISGPLGATRRRAFELAAQAKASNTRLAYRKGWNHYSSWCEKLGFQPLAGNAQQIGLYLAAIAHLAPSTLRQRLAAIVLAHRYAGVSLDSRDYFIVSILQGVDREKGRRPRRQAAPLFPEFVRALLRAAETQDPLVAARDRFLVLLGFGAALRRSELAWLDLGDITVTDKGLRVLVRFSKTDSSGNGEPVAIFAARDPAVCVRRALAEWRALRGDKPGPLLMRIRRGGRLTHDRITDHGINHIVKRLCARADLDARAFSGHSLRAGFASTATSRGASLNQIMRQTRHRSADGVLPYLREREIWDDNASLGILDDQP